VTGPTRAASEGRVSETLEELLESLDRAAAALEARSETRYRTDIENLQRVRQVLQGLDPDEVDALLESDDESE